MDHYTAVLRIQYVTFTWKFTGEWYQFDTYQLPVNALIYECNNIILMKMDYSIVLMDFHLKFKQSGDVFFHFLTTLRKSQSMLSRVQLLWRVSAHFRESLSSLLVELASCVPGVLSPWRRWKAWRETSHLYTERRRSWYCWSRGTCWCGRDQYLSPCYCRLWVRSVYFGRNYEPCFLLSRLRRGCRYFWFSLV